MPHTFVKTQITPFELTLKWQEKTFHLEDIRIKIRKGYGHPDGNRSIFPCLVIERHKKQSFYIEIRQKGKDKLVFHLDPITHVVRSAGVRLALAWFCSNITTFDKNIQFESGNIKEYFDLLNEDPPVRESELKRLKRKISSEIKTANLRIQAERFKLSLENLDLPVKWERVFDNKNPVEIEIGPGKGKFILNEAKNHPERNYVAIEWASRYLKILSERLPKSDIKNLRLMQGDARMILREWVAISSVSKINIYYPDPWWKKKHQKHKLFTNEFLLNVETSLILHGLFLFATDVREVYYSLDELMRSSRLTKVHEKIYINGKEAPPSRSNFEIKKWRGGSNIYEATWQKTD